MAVTIGNGDLSFGGAVLEASDGTKLAVYAYNLTSIVIYSNIDGTPSLEDSDNATTIFGGGSLGWVHAAIDSSDNIHLIVSGVLEQTRDVAYAIATESGGSWTIGTWEEAANYTQAAPDTPGCSISLDVNDKPFVFYVDNVKQGGNNGDNTYLVDKTGASWSTPLQIGVRGTKTYHYWEPTITLKGSNYQYMAYQRSDTVAYKREYTTSLQSEVIVITAVNVRVGFSGIVETTGGQEYVYTVDNEEDIIEDSTDTTYNTDTVARRVSAALVGTDRYIFYIDTSDDVHVISNTGSGWTDESAQQTGTYTYVIAEWAYNNENQSGEINYIFDDGTNVYYDAFSLAAGETFYQSVAGTLTSAGVLKGKGKKVLAGALTSAGALVKKTTESLAGTLTSAGAMVKKTTEALAGTFTSSGVVTGIKKVYQSLAGAFTSSGALKKKTSVSYNGTLTSTGSLVGKALKALGAFFTSSGALTKKTTHSEAGTFTSTGVVAGVKKILKYLAGIFTSSGVLTKKTTHSESGAFTSSGAVFKKGFAALAGTFTSSGVVAGVKKIVKYLAGTFASAGALTKKTAASLTGTWTGIGKVYKKSAEALAGTFTSSGTLRGKILKALAGTLTSAGALTSKAKKLLAGAITFIGSVTTGGNTYYKALAGALTTSGGIAKKVKITLTGVWNAVGAVIKWFYGDVPSSRTYVIAAETRSMAIGDQTRTLVVEAESRIYEVV